MIALTLIAACTWADPGADPYQGRPAAAVESYQDIPADVRARLKARMQARQYDELATIRRDSIEGKAATYSDLRQMHFGRGKLCATVDRSAWKPEHVERGLVYCEAGHCVIVPTVCNNVSRITRVPHPKPPEDPPMPKPDYSEPAGGGFVASGPLLFDPPGAGPSEPLTFAQASYAPGAAVIWHMQPSPWAGIAAPLPVVPEPGTLAMWLLGVGILAWRLKP